MYYTVKGSGDFPSTARQGKCSRPIMTKVVATF